MHDDCVCSGTDTYQKPISHLRSLRLADTANKANLMKSSSKHLEFQHRLDDMVDDINVQTLVVVTTCKAS